MRRERNKNRVNRNKNQIKRGLLLANPVMVLVSITYAFNELTTPEKWLARIRMHITKLTSNPHFPTTTPSVADLTLKADQLENLITAAANGDRELILQRDNCVLEIKEMLTQLGYDVQKQSGGNAEIIVSAGFKTRKARGPLAACVKVVVKKVTALGTGEIELEWSGMTQAKVFWIEIKADTGAPWVVVDLTDKVKFRLHGFLSAEEFILLEPGHRYFFRVRGWNKLGFGAYSEVVDAICTD